MCNLSRPSISCQIMSPRRYIPQYAEVSLTLKLNFRPVVLLARKVGMAGEVASLMLAVELGLMVLNSRRC